MFRHDDVTIRQGKIVLESLAQRGDERQRTAAHQHRGGNLATVSQRDDRLHGHGVKYGSGNVGPAYVLGYEVLDVSLAENAAARRYGVNVFGTRGQAVKLVNAHTKQHGHLVDERSRAAGAVAVHAQVGGAPFAEEHHLGVLAADVDKRRRFGIIFLDGLCGGHHLLDKRQPALLGEAHAHRTGQPDAGLDVAATPHQFAHEACHHLTRVGIVTLITRKKHLAAIADGYRLDRG